MVWRARAGGDRRDPAGAACRQLLGTAHCQGTLAPLGVLSVDIECMPAQDGSFPKPERDRVIQIAAVYARAGRLATPDRKVVLCLDGAAPLPGAEIVACATERELLQRWAALLQELDPDIVTGYNVRGFDLPYLAQRHERACGARSLLWGRDAPTAPPALAALRRENFRSQQSGVREDLVVDVPGRVVLDVLLRVRESHKLQRYSLNNVAAHILNDQKEDVPYASIAGLFRGTPEDRRRLASYCLHDAVLPLRWTDGGESRVRVLRGVRSGAYVRRTGDDVQPGDVQYTKRMPSPFFETPLQSLLVWHQVDTVVITGGSTSGCVRAGAPRRRKTSACGRTFPSSCSASSSANNGICRRYTTSSPCAMPPPASGFCPYGYAIALPCSSAKKSSSP